MIEKKPFGRSEHMSARIIFGAAALGQVTQEEADQTLDILLKYGVNHIDTAASYGDSELRIGPWMKHHRDRFFLATKTGERTYDKAWTEFRRSLERLQVDSVDLLQLHYLVSQEQWDIAMGPGGVLEMAIEARDQGLIRYIGVTGHDVAIAGMHQKSLDRFDFNSVLLPYSYTMAQNAEYIAGFEAVAATCKSRNTAIQTIKSLVRRPWPQEAKRGYATWYEPLTDQDAIDRAVHWVLGNDDVFLNSVGDIHLLPKVLDAASRFDRRPDNNEMAATIDAHDMQPLFV